MQLILLQDVEKLGFKDEIVSVKNGYGRNFLIPTGKAILATESALKVLNENLKQRAKKEGKIYEFLINDSPKETAKKILEFDGKLSAIEISKNLAKLFPLGSEDILNPNIK